MEIGDAGSRLKVGERLTHFRRRLSWTTHSTLSHLQLPQGAPSTTSQRTLRALQLTHARAALRFVILAGGAPSLRSAVDEERFLPCSCSDDVSALDSSFFASVGGAGSSSTAAVKADRSGTGSVVGVASGAAVGAVIVVVSVAIVSR